MIVCDVCGASVVDPAMAMIVWECEAWPSSSNRIERMQVLHKPCDTRALPLSIELTSLVDPRDAIAELCRLLDLYRWERDHLERIIRIVGDLSPEGAEALRRLG